MKIASSVLAALSIVFGTLIIYFMYYADGGADGLSTFIPLAFVGVLFVCCLISFLVTLVLGYGSANRLKWLLPVVIALPILGLLSVVGVFGYFSMDYQSQYEVQVQENKSVLETLQFRDENFGVAFYHVSGNVSTYKNGKAIPTPITPRIEGNILIVPSDDESYLEPDRLIKMESNSNRELSRFLEGLKEKLPLRDAKFKKAASKIFSKLPERAEIWKAENPHVSYQDRLTLGNYFSPELTDFSDLIYFIKPPEKEGQIWVLLVSERISSAAASAEKLSTSNFEDGNLWFHTLEFIH